METIPLKSLSDKVLQRNTEGNSKETPSFPSGKLHGNSMETSEDTGKMMVHMKRLMALDMERDTSCLHGSILALSQKIVAAFFRRDSNTFMAVLPELESLYWKCPIRKSNKD